MVVEGFSSSLMTISSVELGLRKPWVVKREMAFFWLVLTYQIDGQVL
jgi:hypothetical protein